MSPRARIEFDRPARLKVKKGAVTARLKAENEELVLDVRASVLFARCGHDMAVHTSVLTLLDAEGLIPDALIERAYAHARAAAGAYPVREPEPKYEELRLELLREPGPALAALLERDGLVSRYSHPGGPIVYYGRGILAEYRPYVQAPETVAPSAFAAAVAHRQTRDAGHTAIAAAPGGKRQPTPAPAATLTGPGEGEAPAMGGATVPVFRIDKLLKSPLIAEKLVTMITDHGPLDAPGVIECLKQAAGQPRLKRKTEEAIADALTDLKNVGDLTVDDVGRYRAVSGDTPADPSAIGAVIAQDGSDDGDGSHLGNADLGGVPRCVATRSGELTAINRTDEETGTVASEVDGAPDSAEPIGSRGRTEPDASILDGTSASHFVPPVDPQAGYRGTASAGG